jgi:hypothetical protein
VADVRAIVDHATSRGLHLNMDAAYTMAFFDVADALVAADPGLLERHAQHALTMAVPRRLNRVRHLLDVVRVTPDWPAVKYASRMYLDVHGAGPEPGPDPPRPECVAALLDAVPPETRTSFGARLVLDLFNDRGIECHGKAAVELVKLLLRIPGVDPPSSLSGARSPLMVRFLLACGVRACEGDVGKWLRRRDEDLVRELTDNVAAQRSVNRS